VGVQAASGDPVVDRARADVESDGDLLDAQSVVVNRATFEVCGSGE
jgi:hypothetical protein